MSHGTILLQMQEEVSSELDQLMQNEVCSPDKELRRIPKLANIHYNVRTELIFRPHLCQFCLQRT